MSMHIEQLNAITSERLAVIDIDAPLHVAALALSNPAVGLTVVSDRSGRAMGVLSKSDLIRHLARTDAKDVSVATLMSRDIVSCRPGDEVHAVWETMVARGLQNIPILGQEAEPLGILAVGDAMKVLFEQEELEERMLANYVAGIGYR
jgi:CBS domain-containing protein